MHFNQLIIGQGLAGSLLAYQLMRQNQSVMVVDDGLKYTSSRVAAGMFTPISGKRMVKSWKVDELFPIMQETYLELEKLLDESFLNNQNIQLSFSSIKEQNDFYSALTDKINKYVVPEEITPHNGINAPFGAVEIKQSGWLNTVKFLDAIRKYLQEKNCFMQKEFFANDLVFENEKWQYQSHSFDSVIFCQGYRNKYNSYFAHIPVIDNKGDVFTVTTDVLDDKKIYKRGCYAVQLEQGIYKVGSTFKWDNDNTTPTKAGFDELNEKTEALINGAYQVIDHYVGIRPTTKDRRPILGKHTQHKNMYVFNGLGTKGVLLAPHFSKVMADYILHNTLPDAAIAADRLI